MNEFIKTHGVRLFALLAAAVPLVSAQLPDVPWEAVLGAAAVLLGAGEVAQRVENGKTVEALHETSPWDRAAEHQAQVTEAELRQPRI